MWDNAPLLRSIANGLLGFSVLALLYGAVHYLVHLPTVLPLRSVHLNAPLQRVNADDVQQVVRTEVQGNLVTVDIERLRQALEQVPWVRRVSIRREFPDRLTVRLEEHQAFARWNGSALVNRQGEVFEARSNEALPEFVGQDGAAAAMLQYYNQFSRQLAGLELQVHQLVLTPRHAWQLRLSNGMVLQLGREHMQERLAAFVTVYPYSLAKLADGTIPGATGQGAGGRTSAREQVKYVDLRYRNGFAVRFGRGNA